MTVYFLLYIAYNLFFCVKYKLFIVIYNISRSSTSSLYFEFC